MANTPQAKKRIRRNANRTVINHSRVSRIRTFIKAVEAALEGRSGVVGHDEERGDELRSIEFPRIAGHKKFDPQVDWFQELLTSIGQL